LDELLQPRSDAEPSGPNLEYEPVFTALMLAARPTEERQMGDQVLASEEPDWRDVAGRAEAVLGQSHDLRVAAVLALARTRHLGFEGLAPVMAYVRGCLEQHWDSCHPQLDADDDDDPTMRINAVLSLTDAGGLMRAVRLSPLTDSATFGRLTLRDLAVADGEIEQPADMPRKPDAASVAAAFKDTRKDVLRARAEALRGIAADLAAIDRVFDDRTPGRGPDLAPLARLIRKAHLRAAAALGEEVPALPGAGAADNPAAAPAPGAASVASGPVTSPAQVRATLEELIRYYDTYEPSSPLPMLLRRAHRLVGADFLTILKDLAPDSLDDLRKLGGMGDEDDD
jgi:type VI secretion system protein ImpA